MKLSMKALREKAEAITEIESKEQLLEALSTLAQISDLNAINKKHLKKCEQIAAELSDLCTVYASTHQEVFDGGSMIRNQNGVYVGDITADDTLHHLACGFKGYIRMNGEKLTQDFLEALPKGWKKSKVELDVTGINNAVNKGADPATYGLADKPNNVWTHKEA